MVLAGGAAGRWLGHEDGGDRIPALIRRDRRACFLSRLPTMWTYSRGQLSADQAVGSHQTLGLLAPCESYVYVVKRSSVWCFCDNSLKWLTLAFLSRRKPMMLHRAGCGHISAGLASPRSIKLAHHVWWVAFENQTLFCKCRDGGFGALGREGRFVSRVSVSTTHTSSSVQYNPWDPLHCKATLGEPFHCRETSRCPLFWEGLSHFKKSDSQFSKALLISGKKEGERQRRREGGDNSIDNEIYIYISQRRISF